MTGSAMTGSAMTGIELCVFDAYGTLYDFNSAVARHRAAVGPKADALSEMWRSKQIQYTWLRNSMGAYAPFWQVTGEALDHCLAAHGIADPSVRDRLMGAYLALDPFPEVPAMLDRLRRAGVRCAILSNGNPEMLEPMVEASGLADRFEAVLSVDAARVFKVDRRPKPGRGALRREARQGLLPVVELLGRARRGAVRLQRRLGQPRGRAGRQPAGQAGRAGQRPFPPPRSVGCCLMSSLPTFADVQAAARRLEGVAIRTPLLENPRVNDKLGGRLFIKAECLQRTGSFKIRGAYNFLASMSEADRKKGVVGWSSGNHAQGLAEAGRLLGVKTTIVMPADAPALKVANTRASGAEVVLYDRVKESREEIGIGIAKKTGATVVPPYDHPWILTGQGTAGLELAEQAKALGVTLDAVAAPCSGGGLSTGVALGVKGLMPNTSGACRRAGGLRRPRALAQERQEGDQRQALRLDLRRAAGADAGRRHFPAGAEGARGRGWW